MTDTNTIPYAPYCDGPKNEAGFVTTKNDTVEGNNNLVQKKFETIFLETKSA